MSLGKIKEMQDTIEALETRVSELAERKTKVPTERVEKTAKLAQRAADAYLLSKVRDVTIDQLSGFEDVKDYASRAIVPADLPSWLKEEFSNDIYERMTLIANVEALFPKYTIPSNTESLSIPQKTSKTKAYLIAPSNEAIQSAITAAKVTFRAKRLITLSTISDQANDETVVALINIVKQDIAESLVYAMENAIINGDTNATAANINGATVGADANDQTKVFDGLRKITGVTNANTVDFGGAVAYASFLAMRKKMGKDGINQSDLVYVVSPSVYHQMIGLAEIQTVDKYGMAATVVTGEVAKIGAIPVIVSEFIPENLTAAGIYDGVTTNKSVVLLVNRKYFAVADRGATGFEKDRSITATTDMFVGYRDVDFKPLLPNAEISVVGLNVSI